MNLKHISKLSGVFNHVGSYVCMSACLASGFTLNAQAGETQMKNKAESHFIIGGGVGYEAEYTGADKRRAGALLYLDYQHESGFFASFFRGIGYQTSFDQLMLSAALAYDPGREESKSGSGFRSGSADLRGMGEIRSSAQLRLAANYDLGAAGINFAANLPLSQRDNGASYQFGLTADIYGDQTDQVELELSALYGDRKHMQTQFGVTAVQSANSGYRQYTPKSGIETVNLGVNWTHQFSKNWSSRSSLSWQTVVGEAADSPIVKKKSSPQLMVTANYMF